MTGDGGRATGSGASATVQRSLYPRLLGFLRPHWWRMAGTIACNLLAAVLDVFTVTLLIPFLSALFGQPAVGPITDIQQDLIGALPRSSRTGWDHCATSWS